MYVEPALINYKTEQYIFSCADLHSAYKEYLYPYLGAMQYFTDVENALMNELMLELKPYESIEGYTILQIIEELEISTHVRETFRFWVDRVIKHVINNLDRVLKDKLVTDFLVMPGYTLIASVIKYNTEENTDVRRCSLDG
jgi:hypothetical protein